MKRLRMLVAYGTRRLQTASMCSQRKQIRLFQAWDELRRDGAEANGAGSGGSTRNSFGGRWLIVDLASVTAITQVGACVPPNLKTQCT